MSGKRERERERFSSMVMMTRSKRTTVADLPEEIIDEILSLLPVKTLIKFRCVSKSWLCLISNPKFIKTHLIKSSNSTNFAHHRLIIRQINMNIAPCSSSYHLYSCSLPNNNSSNLNNIVELDYPVKDHLCSVSIIGSCNGLVLLIIGKVGVFIWNPSTRKSKELQNSDIDWPTNYNYGFGYDQLNDDYKVVRIVRDRRLDHPREGEVKIYSLKKDSWGKIGNFPCGFHWNERGKYVNGKLHWKVADVRRANGLSIVIVSIDLGNETYGEIAQPCYGDGTIIVLSLGVLEGCLSVFCSYNSTFEKKKCFDIWVMKEYGVSDTWIKLYTIPDAVSPGALFYYPLSVSAMGEILLKSGSCLVLYDPNNGRFRNAIIGSLLLCLNGLEATTYVESLVSPNINDEVQSPQH